MKALLEFNLDEPDDRAQHGRMLMATDMQCALQEFCQFLRGKIKYSELTDEQEKIYEEIRDEFWRTMNENDVEVL